MVRNLERHKVEEVAEGIQWAQWQALQLESLDRYARQNAIKQGRRFDKLNERIESLIAKEYTAAGMEQERAILNAVRKGWEAPRTPDLAFFEAPHERLDALIRATHSDLMKAEHAVLRRANDQYRQIIFDAQVYAQSGAGTYAKAVDMATKDFLAKGVDGIVYRNGARHTIPDYASMCLRTSTKRAALVAEGDARTEWGVNTVVVDRRDDACPECMEWVGEVLVDDVYGSGTAEEAQRLGCSLLSEAMDAGLFHPNCRDTVSTWFPGVSDMPEPPSRADQSRAEVREAVEEVENTAKNAEARYERLSEYSLDPANAERYAAKAEEWAEKAEAVEKAAPVAVEEIGKAEADAVEWYVSGEGMYINQALRGRSGITLDASEKQAVELIDRATDNEVKRDVLWRSVDAEAILGKVTDLEYDNMLSRYVYGLDDKLHEKAAERVERSVGRTLTEKGFMSTTTDKEAALEWMGFTGSSKPVVLEISNAKAARGLDLAEKLPELEKLMEQNEVLLARNTQYRIKGVRGEGGQLVFEVEVLPR